MHKRIGIDPVAYRLSDDTGEYGLMFEDSTQKILLKMENQSESIQVYLDSFENPFTVSKIGYLSDIGAIFMRLSPNSELSSVAIYLESLNRLSELDGILSDYVGNSKTEYVFR